MESLIRQILREAASGAKVGKSDKWGDNMGKTSDEKGTEPDVSQYEDESEISSKYEKVKDLLANNIFNHAGVIERLWGEADATNRSLFRKKLEQELNDNGTPYSFDDDEVSKIISILMDTSKQINKKFSKKKG
jgi:hypothetical protein